jgi:hypothetical protein
LTHAYTPGLKVLAHTVLTKERRLPLPGNILVNKNDKVAGEQVVARTNLPGNVQTLNVAGLLGILADEVDGAKTKLLLRTKVFSVFLNHKSKVQLRVS